MFPSIRVGIRLPGIFSLLASKDSSKDNSSIATEIWIDPSCLAAYRLHRSSFSGISFKPKRLSRTAVNSFSTPTSTINSSSCVVLINSPKFMRDLNAPGRQPTLSKFRVRPTTHFHQRPGTATIIIIAYPIAITSSMDAVHRLPLSLLAFLNPHLPSAFHCVHSWQRLSRLLVNINPLESEQVENNPMSS